MEFGMTEPLRAAFIGSTASVFVTRTAAELRNRGFAIEVIDCHELSAQSVGVLAAALRAIGLGRLVRVSARMRAMRRAIADMRSGRVVVIHGLGIDIIWMVPMLRRRKLRIIGFAHGSDILRRNRRRDWLIARALYGMSCIVATNYNVIREVGRSFPELESARLGVVRFGLPVLDALDGLDPPQADRAAIKRSLGLDPDCYVVSLGYNSSPGQRQLDLLRSARQWAERLEHVQFVVPVQYSHQATRDAVVELCGTFNRELRSSRFVPIVAFFDINRSAQLRLATDVLINHSVSDAFSATVQEVLYCGHAVLAAEHLPYASMPGAETGIVTYATLDEVEHHLTKDQLSKWLLRTRNLRAQTAAAIRVTSSWDGVIADWRRLIAEEDA